MNSSIRVVRAVGAELANRLWKSSLIIAIIGAALVVVLMWWLTSISSWWWLLAIPFGIAFSVGLVLLIVFRLLIRYVRPSQNKTQFRAVSSFVDKLEHLSEVAQTPKFFLLFRVVRDIAAPSGGYIQSIARSTTSLKKDFTDLQKLFS